MTQQKQIRAKALGVIQHEGRLLVFEGYDSVKDETYYRPLGGGIEFGETGAQAMAREIREEIGAEVTNVRYLGLSENIFTCNRRGRARDRAALRGGVGGQIALRAGRSRGGRTGRLDIHGLVEAPGRFRRWPHAALPGWAARSADRKSPCSLTPSTSCAPASSNSRGDTPIWRCSRRKSWRAPRPLPYLAMTAPSCATARCRGRAA